MKKILVKCILEVPVEVPDDKDYDEIFDIEENHCPGTGIVGGKIDEIIKKAEKDGYCWACNLNGKNEIIRELSDEEYKSLNIV